MEITEVRIKLVQESQDRLLAFCSITLDGAFVIRDLKIIQGTRNAFVAMPSRKLMDRCRRCGGKNALRSSYCNQCGTRLAEDRAPRDTAGRAKLYADIAHPIHTDCREMIQAAVLKAYEEELIAAQSPGYICRYDDFGENDSSLPAEFDSIDFEIGPPPSSRPADVRRTEDAGTQRFEPAANQPAQTPHLDHGSPTGKPRRETPPNATVKARTSADPDFGEGID